MITDIEYHPFEPFLPDNAKVLFLGSFPPGSKRWSMDFYYPNFINDFWRIMGMIYFGQRDYFVRSGHKSFDKEHIIRFCKDQGFALYDTAYAIKRLKDNASDKFLEVIESVNVASLLDQIPNCKIIAATGQKAAEIVAEQFHVPAPAVGSSCKIKGSGGDILFWRMPSTSRAYPLSIDKKAGIYRTMLDSVTV